MAHIEHNSTIHCDGITNNEFCYCKYTRQELLNSGIPIGGVCSDPECGHRVGLHSAGVQSTYDPIIIEPIVEKIEQALTKRWKVEDNNDFKISKMFNSQALTIFKPHSSKKSSDTTRVCLICGKSPTQSEPIESAHIISIEWADWLSPNADIRLMNPYHHERSLILDWTNALAQNRKWERPFLFHDSLNKIPLCPKHNINFGNLLFTFKYNTLSEQNTWSFLCEPSSSDQRVVRFWTQLKEETKLDDPKQIENQINDRLANYNLEIKCYHRALSYHFFRYCEKWGLVTDDINTHVKDLINRSLSQSPVQDTDEVSLSLKS